MTKQDQVRPNEHGNARRPRPFKRALPVLFLFAVSVALYWDSVHNDFVVDAVPLIKHNPQVRSWNGAVSLLHSGYWEKAGFAEGDLLYRPLTMMSFAANYLSAGPNPFWFLLPNVLCNALVVVLAFFVVDRLFGNRLLAFIAALLYAFLPCHVEPVAQVVGRADLLAMSLGLGAWLFHLQRRGWGYVPALLLFAGALLAKESAIVFPVCFLAADYARIRLRVTGQGHVAETAVAQGANESSSPAANSVPSPLSQRGARRDFVRPLAPAPGSDTDESPTPIGGTPVLLRARGLESESNHAGADGRHGSAHGTGEMLRRFAAFCAIIGLYLAVRWALLGRLVTDQQTTYFGGKSRLVASLTMARYSAELYARWLVLGTKMAEACTRPDFPDAAIGDVAAWFMLLGLFLVVVATLVLFSKRPAPGLFGVVFFLVGMAPVSNFSVGIAALAGVRFLYLPSFGYSLFAAAVLCLFFRKPTGSGATSRLDFGQSLQAPENCAALEATNVASKSLARGAVAASPDGNPTCPPFSKGGNDIVARCSDGSSMLLPPFSKGGPGGIFVSRRDRRNSSATPPSSTAPPSRLLPAACGLFALVLFCYAWRIREEIPRFRSDVAVCRSVLRESPDSLFVKHNLAVALCAQNEYDEAKALLESVCAEAPHLACVWHNLGLTYQQEGDLPAAETAFALALELERDPAGASEIHAALGRIAEMKGDLNGARRHLLYAIAYRCTNGRAHLDLGNIGFKEGKLEEAERRYRAALEAEPDLEQAWQNLGTALIARGKYQDALTEAYEPLLTRSPESSEAFAGQGRALMGLGRLDQAETALLRACELGMRNADPRIHLCTLYLMQKRFEDAVRFGEDALAVGAGELPELLHNLATAYETRDVEKAVSTWQRFLQATEKDAKYAEAAKTAREHIRKLRETK